MAGPGKLLFRRAFVALMTRSAFGLSLWSFIPRTPAASEPAGTEPSADPGINLLATLIRDLYPHNKLDDGFYRDIARGVWDQARASEITMGRLLAGVRELDRLTGDRGWPAADRDTRLAVLATLESEPFFRNVMSVAAELVYRDPRVWEIIGYGGNALAQGGYLHRGFNDIAWLPERPAP